MKITWKSYFEPTPKLIRKLADSILGGATLASTWAFVAEHETAAIITMVAAVVAKILSNFFTDNNDTAAP